MMACVRLAGMSFQAESRDTWKRRRAPSAWCREEDTAAAPRRGAALPALQDLQNSDFS